MQSSDVFAGLDTLPQEAAQLHDYAQLLAQRLQSQYDIAPQVALFATQPQNDVAFRNAYVAEVTRIFATLASVTGNAAYTRVRVDPLQCAGGFALDNVCGHNEAVGTSAKDDDATPTTTTASVTPRFRTGAAAVATTAVTAATAAVTTAAANDAHSSVSPLNDSASATVDSTARPRQERCVFTTPPHFCGFAVPLATPSASDDGSPQ